MSANLSAVPKLQFFDNNGNPLVGGKLYTYAAGTTTPQATFTDASATTPNTNPIILDSRGEANVWLSATTYKFVLKDASDATIWTVDNISNSLSLSQILAASGSAASPPYTFASDTDTGMYLAAVGQLGLTVAGTPVLRATSTDMVLSTSGLDRVVINASGSVGIGTSTPGNRLQVSSPLTGTTPRSNSVLRVQSEATGRDVNIQLSDNVTNSAEVGMVSGALYFATAGDERMRIDVSGNVGIGTNAPTYTLDINKASANFRVRDASGGNDFVIRSIAGPTTVFGSMSNTAVALTTNDISRIWVTNSGNVGIGTTNPQTKLHIDSGPTDEVARFESTGLPFLSLYDTNVRQSYWYSAGGSIQLVATTGKPLALIAEGPQEVSIFTNNVNRFSVSSTGAQSSVIPNGSTLYPQFACRAWINFDGTSGSIGTGRGSGNVSSVTDNGTGDYTVNFSTAMPDANYAVTGVVKEFNNTNNSSVVFYLAEQTIANTLSTSFVRVRAASPGFVPVDSVVVNVAVFR